MLGIQSSGKPRSIDTAKGHRGVETVVVLLLLAVGAAGAQAQLCETDPPPVIDCTPGDIIDPAMCPNGFEIEYNGRVHELGPPETTTFMYSIVGPGPGNCRRVRDVSHFSLVWPLCEPPLEAVDSTPSGELKLGLKGDPSTGYCVGDPNADLIKIDHEAFCDGASVPFSVTFAGNVPEGDAEVLLKAGRDAYLASITGPSCDLACDLEAGPYPDCCPDFPADCQENETCLGECF